VFDTALGLPGDLATAYFSADSSADFIGLLAEHIEPRA